MTERESLRRYPLRRSEDLAKFMKACGGPRTERLTIRFWPECELPTGSGKTSDAGCRPTYDGHQSPTRMTQPDMANRSFHHLSARHDGREGRCSRSSHSVGRVRVSRRRRCAGTSAGVRDPPAGERRTCLPAAPDIRSKPCRPRTRLLPCQFLPCRCNVARSTAIPNNLGPVASSRDPHAHGHVASRRLRKAPLYAYYIWHWLHRHGRIDKASRVRGRQGLDRIFRSMLEGTSSPPRRGIAHASGRSCASRRSRNERGPTSAMSRKAPSRHRASADEVMK